MTRYCALPIYMHVPVRAMSKVTSMFFFIQLENVFFLQPEYILFVGNVGL